MEDRNITEALAYDRDFEQAGFTALLREGRARAELGESERWNILIADSLSACGRAEVLERSPCDPP